MAIWAALIRPRVRAAAILARAANDTRLSLSLRASLDYLAVVAYLRLVERVFWNADLPARDDSIISRPSRGKAAASLVVGRIALAGGQPR